MWEIGGTDVVNLRILGGQAFASFVDALIRAEARFVGIPDSEIATNVKTTVGDGGVDAAVDAPGTGDSTGRLGVPSCWQYKAEPSSEVYEASVTKEIWKPYAKELIERGYGYRLCVCDDFAAAKRAEIQGVLLREAKKINPDAPQPLLISASDLAAWASTYPAIVVRFFRPNLNGVQHFDSWGQNARALASSYVEVSRWEPVGKAIAEHVDVSKPALQAVLTVQGEAGVGKTRLAFETVARVPGARDLVLYTLDDEVATSLATAVANESDVRVILIADDCPVASRIRLEETLKGHCSRARVVAIDNTGERPATSAPEAWLTTMPDEDVDAILTLNFPVVSQDRRRAYVALSHGFVRFAIALCRQDLQIAATGHLGPALGSIEETFQARLSDDDRKVVEALALLRKVGFRGDVENELGELCALVGLDRKRVAEAVNARLRDAPGFVVVAGRYYYVSPEIIARVAFQRGWRRWIASDHEGFLRRLPASLLQPFIERVTSSGSKEVRRVVGDTFRHWFLALGPVALTDGELVDRAVALVEMEPDSYLTLLRSLVDRAPDDVLAGRVGSGTGFGRAHRALVWLAERLAAFPQYFEDAEAILLQLATHETEPGIGNNASHTWQRLFQIRLSGTAIPFTARLPLLERRLFSDRESVVTLALGALGEIFAPHHFRLVGPALVAGRILPEEWKPRDQTDLKACFEAGLGLLQRMAASTSPKLRVAVLDIVTGEMRSLLVAGYLTDVQELVAANSIPPDRLPRLIAAVEDFLEFDERRGAGELADYRDAVSHWVTSLVPDSFHARLVATIGQNPWRHTVRSTGDTWLREVAHLADELLRNPSLLHDEMDWLSSKDAKSADALGEALGLRDVRNEHLDTILSSAQARSVTSLARGYLLGVLRTQPEMIASVNERLDRMESQAPVVAFDLSLALGPSTHPIVRTLRLVDAKALPVERLWGFLGVAARGELNVGEYRELLRRLVEAIPDGPAAVRSLAIEFCAYGLRGHGDDHQRRLLSDGDLQVLIWRLVELTTEDAGRESHWWIELLEALATIDADRVAAIASRALLSENFDQEEAGETVLTKIATVAPESVMAHLGEAILDPQRGWHFLIGSHRKLIGALPTNVVEAWLREKGVEGARRIARHLPLPYVDADDRPVIPLLTEYVLKEFEGDDDTFAGFIAGVHSMQLYQGDIAEQHRAEAIVARRFLGHPLRRVSEWADVEIRSAQESSARWQQIQEERMIG